MQPGQTVGIVTGGASGLGAGVVGMLVDEGGQAAILDLPGSRGADLAAELGERAAFFPVDVTDPDQVERAVANVVERFGRIDLVVNSAGISTPMRVVGRDGSPHPLDHFLRHLAVNLVGAFDVLRHAAAAMARNEPGEGGERGLIVNIASIAAIEGQVGQASYSASKGGLAALTLPLARDLATQGIRVMCICPGIMDTPMLAGVDDELKERLVDLAVFPKRLGQPADVAGLVRSLLVNPYLNGDVVRLDAAVRLAAR